MFNLHLRNYPAEFYAVRSVNERVVEVIFMTQAECEEWDQETPTWKFTSRYHALKFAAEHGYVLDEDDEMFLLEWETEHARLFPQTYQPRTAPAPPPAPPAPPVIRISSQTKQARNVKAIVKAVQEAAKDEGPAPKAREVEKASETVSQSVLVDGLWMRGDRRNIITGSTPLPKVQKTTFPATEMKKTGWMQEKADQTAEKKRVNWVYVVRRGFQVAKVYLSDLLNAEWKGGTAIATYEEALIESIKLGWRPTPTEVKYLRANSLGQHLPAPISPYKKTGWTSIPAIERIEPVVHEEDRHCTDRKYSGGGHALEPVCFPQWTPYHRSGKVPIRNHHS